MKEKKYKLIIGSAVLGTIFALGIAALLINILEKKMEAKNSYFRVTNITEDTEDPAIWGKNFPKQYEMYLKTSDQVRTRYGGSEAMPHTPSQSDPRSIVAQSKLEEDPRLVAMWSGYAFSKDTREDRGHAYMFVDQKHTLRTNVVKQPGTCLNCHASTAVLYKKLGEGDPVKGFHVLNSMEFHEAASKANHPVACVDCHKADTMELRITRPAFMDGIRRYKASQGIKDYDVNKMASRQEMRSYVCSQCHVEYYFKGKEKTLYFPWDNGLKIEQILAYYDSVNHKDWEHKVSKAPVLKAQHPEFELFSQGIHAQAGVTCTDCHMPYTKVGSQKVTDHHVQSPLLNIDNACRTCHSVPASELKRRAENIQETTYRMRGLALDALMELIKDIESAEKAGVNLAKLTEARKFQRNAQFYADFIEAENSMGFHAPQEATRILGESINFSRKGQQALR